MAKKTATFDTYWTQHTFTSFVLSQDLTNRQAGFFELREPNEVTCVLPDNILLKEVTPFAGKKTRVTIEVIE